MTPQGIGRTTHAEEDIAEAFELDIRVSTDAEQEALATATASSCFPHCTCPPPAE